MSTNLPLKKQSHKVGTWPLRNLSNEEQADWYWCSEYLYESPHGFVWIRHNHDMRSGEFLVWMEFVFRGRKYEGFETTRKQRSPASLRLLARRFADETVADFHA